MLNLMQLRRLIWRETLATLGGLGAALTILSKLTRLAPMPDWMVAALTLWKNKVSALIGAPLWPFEAALHPHIAASIAMVGFLLMMAIGANLSGRLQGKSEPSPSIVELVRYGGYFSKRDSWIVLAIFGALLLVFVADSGTAAKIPKPWDLAPSWIGTAGLFAGFYIGRYEFFRRLVRLALLVLAVVGVTTISSLAN